jgi:hypothetical protein
LQESTNRSFNFEKVCRPDCWPYEWARYIHHGWHVEKGGLNREHASLHSNLGVHKGNNVQAVGAKVTMHQKDTIYNIKEQDRQKQNIVIWLLFYEFFCRNDSD